MNVSAHIPSSKEQPANLKFMTWMGECFYQALSWGPHWLECWFLRGPGWTLYLYLFTEASKVDRRSWVALHQGGEGGPTGEWDFCVSIFLTRYLGKALAWKMPWRYRNLVVVEVGSQIWLALSYMHLNIYLLVILGCMVMGMKRSVAVGVS